MSVDSEYVPPIFSLFKKSIENYWRFVLLIVFYMLLEKINLTFITNLYYWIFVLRSRVYAL